MCESASCASACAGNYVVQTNPIVTVNVTSQFTSFLNERRFDRGTTVGKLKDNLELITGASPATMTIDVYDIQDKKLFTLSNDNAVLGEYGIEDGMRLHVTDSGSGGINFDDTSKVEKFEITDDEYSSKRGTVRDFLKRNKMGKYNPETIAETERLKQEQALEDEKDMERIKVGARCEVTVAGQMARRGCVRYIGETEFKEGLWVGVQYDEPYGKHDGTVKGKRYFTCPQGYGSFVKPKNVETGDFPEIDDLDFSDDEM